jgi:transcriptional regulator with XRE-family HTH domain
MNTDARRTFQFHVGQYRRRFSPEYLVQKTGLSMATIMAIEAGERTPTQVELKRLRAVLALPWHCVEPFIPAALPPRKPPRPRKPRPPKPTLEEARHARRLETSRRWYQDHRAQRLVEMRRYSRAWYAKRKKKGTP